MEGDNIKQDLRYTKKVYKYMFDFFLLITSGPIYYEGPL